jgi:hypothetical protein
MKQRGTRRHEGILSVRPGKYRALPLFVDGALMVPLQELLTRLGLLQLVKMLNCYQGAGFWSGVAMSLVTIGYLNAQVAAAAADSRGPEVAPDGVDLEPAEKL